MRYGLGRFRAFCLFVGAASFWMPVSPARANITEFDIYRIKEFSQSSSAVPSAPYGYAFESNVDMSSPTDFTGGTLNYPGNGSPAPYTYVSNGINSAYLNYTRQPYASLNTFNTAFPTGTYTATATNSITMTSQSTSMTYSQDLYPQSTPALTPPSYTAMQNSYDPSQAMTVHFTTLVPAAQPANQTDISFAVYDPNGVEVFEAPPIQNDIITSLTIPAGTLQPYTSYTYTLDFSDRQVSGNPTDGVYDVQAFDDVTTGDFTTVPEPVSIALLLPAGALLLGRRRI